jgi:hypothetical protein
VYKETSRYTPYHLPHQTDVAGLSIILNGDDRFYNNLFLPTNPDEKKAYGLAAYDKAGYPSFAAGNVYYAPALPLEAEAYKRTMSDTPNVKIEEIGKEVYLSFSFHETDIMKMEIIDTKRLGEAKLPKQRYEHPDGQPIIFNVDYLGNLRSEHPVPGPFEQVKAGDVRLKVW